MNVTWQPRREDWNVHEGNDDFTVLVSGGRGVDAIEWAHELCGRPIQNDWVEQQICIRFCIKLEHSSTEILWMIQKAFRDDAMNAAQSKCGTDASKTVENLLKVIHFLEGQQQAEPLSMVNV